MTFSQTRKISVKNKREIGTGLKRVVSVYETYRKLRPLFTRADPCVCEVIILGVFSNNEGNGVSEKTPFSSLVSVEISEMNTAS